MPTIAPRKVIQTNAKRGISSDRSMPVLKNSRSTTLPNTITSITARHSTITISSARVSASASDFSRFPIGRLR